MKSKISTSSLLGSLPGAFFLERRHIVLDKLIPVVDSTMDVDVVLAMLAGSDEGVEANTIIYNTSISACEDMDGEGVDTNTFTYNASISACEEMDGEGVEANTFISNAAMSACEKAKGVGVEAFTFTYNAAISACEKADGERGETDTFTYNTDASACEKASGEGVEANTFAYDAAIGACTEACREGVEAEASTCNAARCACEKADCMGVEADTSIYNAANSACEKADGVGVESDEAGNNYTIMCNAAVGACEKTGDEGNAGRDIVTCNAAMCSEIADDDEGIPDFTLEQLHRIITETVDCVKAVVDWPLSSKIWQDVDLDVRRVIPPPVGGQACSFSGSQARGVIELTIARCHDMLQRHGVPPSAIDLTSQRCTMCRKKLTEFEIRNRGGSCDYCFHMVNTND